MRIAIAFAAVLLAATAKGASPQAAAPAPRAPADTAAARRLAAALLQVAGLEEFVQLATATGEEIFVRQATRVGSGSSHPADSARAFVRSAVSGPSVRAHVVRGLAAELTEADLRKMIKLARSAPGRRYTAALAEATRAVRGMDLWVDSVGSRGTAELRDAFSRMSPAARRELDAFLRTPDGWRFSRLSGDVMRLALASFQEQLGARVAGTGRAPVGERAEVRLDQPVRAPGDAPYFEFQVEDPVQPLPGNSPPAYPELLRSANVTGFVIAQFVVDTLGRADTATIKMLKSSHELFSQAVRAAIPAMRFKPARTGGRKVKQLVQQRFDFNLSSADSVRPPR